jgi:hypothetical protein
VLQILLVRVQVLLQVVFVEVVLQVLLVLLLLLLLLVLLAIGLHELQVVAPMSWLQVAGYGA